MSEHAEAPVITGPIDTLLSMGFCMVELIRVDMFKTRIGDVIIVAALWPDGEVEMRAKADGVADSFTLRRWLRTGTPADDCKAAVLDLWKRCSEYSSSTVHGVPEGSEGIGPQGKVAADSESTDIDRNTRKSID